MELPSAASQPEREQLTQVRAILLTLHKALLDSERTAYELVHGKVASPGAFLQLLINDNRFAWLRPVTTLLVEIDESLVAKNPPRDKREVEQLINDTRALLSPSGAADDEFWRRYSGVVQRDPGVAVLHDEIAQQLAHLNF